MYVTRFARNLAPPPPIAKSWIRPCPPPPPAQTCYPKRSDRALNTRDTNPLTKNCGITPRKEAKPEKTLTNILYTNNHKRPASRGRTHKYEMSECPARLQTSIRPHKLVRCNVRHLLSPQGMSTGSIEGRHSPMASIWTDGAPDSEQFSSADPGSHGSRSQLFQRETPGSQA